MGSKPGGIAQLMLAWRHNRRGLWRGGHLMVLSHMRAFSSQLVQVLGGHPEICGHGEQCVSYRSRFDFFRVRVQLGASDASFPSQQWYLDQVLHGRFELDPALLRDERSRILVMVRHPEATLPNLVDSRRGRRKRDRFANPALAASYYLARLESIAAVAEAAPCAKVYVPSEKLVTNQTATLAALTKWLGLEQPLSARYRVFDSGSDLSRGTTGFDQAAASAGAPPANLGDEAIPPGLVERCVAAYDDFCAAINEVCEPLPISPSRPLVAG